MNKKSIYSDPFDLDPIDFDSLIFPLIFLMTQKITLIMILKNTIVEILNIISTKPLPTDVGRFGSMLIDVLKYDIIRDHPAC